MASFIRVQAILDQLIEQWARQRERQPNLRVHGNSFSWRSKDELLQSVAFGKRLIAPEDIQNKTGTNSNLVVALRTGVAPYSRMPRGGPFISDSELQEVIDWIDSGTPD